MNDLRSPDILDMAKAAAIPTICASIAPRGPSCPSGRVRVVAPESNSYRKSKARPC